MVHLTYTSKLLQTKGKKGKALHEAMRRWTQTHTEFLDLCAGRADEFEAACTLEGPRGPRRSNLSLQKWIRQEIRRLPSFAVLEISVQDSLIVHLAGQLLSFLELRGLQDRTGFPSGRGHGELQFEHYADEFVQRDWGMGDEAEELEYVTVQGKVQGYRPKHVYSPMEICRYDAAGKNRNYRLLRSPDGQLFALIYLLPAERGTTPTRGDLVEVVTGTVQRSISSKAALFPLGASKWVLRKLTHWTPKASRIVHRDGEFYLHIAFEAPAAEPKQWDTILGVDRGKFRLASYAVVSATGKPLTKDSILGYGLHPKRVNEISAKIRKAQASGGHFRYKKYRSINEEAAHTIANQIIDVAKKHRSKIVVEDLGSMMHAMMAKSAKSNFNKGRKSNIYAGLLRVLEYRCALVGIELEKADARHTSQTCPACGTVDRRNRLTVRQSKGGKERVLRERFKCVNCSFEDSDADAVAAINIARKALFKQACIQGKKQGNKLTWQEFASHICSA